MLGAAVQVVGSRVALNDQYKKSFPEEPRAERTLAN